ncbi:MAG: SGNH/GDSL hydrolase family protein, partial [Nitrospirales bacterium]
MVETPYGAVLQRLVGDQALVSVSGVCGELTGNMARRFSREISTRMPQFVVILGGTNDLGWDVPVQEAAANLCAMYDRARQAGAEPIAVTVPSLRPFEPPAPREATFWL